MNRIARAWLTYLALGLATLALIAGCARDDSASGGQTGGLAVQVIWGDGTPRFSTQQAAQRLGAPPSVLTIQADVLGPGMSPVSRTFTASAGSGAIDNIPVGSSRQLILQGLDAGGITLYEKTTTGITIAAGTNSPLVVVLDPTSLPPGEVSAFSASSTSGQITLSWTNPGDTNLVGVMIRRATGDFPASFTDGTLVYDGDGIAGTHVDAGLSNGTPYYYKAFTHNDLGIYSAGVTVAATPSAAPTPTGVLATAGDGQVQVTWDPAAGALSYNLYWSTSPFSSIATASKEAGATSPFSHLGRINGTTYYYRVTSVVAGPIESSPSDEASATPQPPAPTGAPTVTANAGNQLVTLTWPAVTGATGYNVYWSLSPITDLPAVDKIPDAPSGYVHAGLTNGTTYYYKVTAKNAGGEGPESTEDSATPFLAGIPGGVAAAPGNRQVTISWNPVSGATSYNLYRATAAGVMPGGGGVTAILGVTSPYPDGSLTNGTVYYYVVTAVVSAIEGNPSTEVSATPEAPPPATVTATQGNTLVTLSWSAVPNAASYNIYWSTTAFVNPATANKITGPTSPYPHTGRTNGTTYYYVVTTVSGTGESDASQEVSATPQVPPPAAPTGFSAPASTGLVTLNWTPVSGATGYNLYWGTTAGVTPGGSGVSQIAGVTAPYPHTGRSNGSTYYYVVTAYNAAGEGAASSEASATPIAQPTGLTATGGDTVVTLSWSAAAGATSYTLYRSTISGSGTGGTPIAAVTSPYVDGGRINGTTYYYVVTGVNASGSSIASTQASATPQVPAPSAPTGVVAAGGDASVTVSWSDASGATSYNLYWSSPTALGTGGTQIATVTSPYVHAGRTNGTLYHYVVTAQNAGGESGASANVSATPLAPAAEPTGVTAVIGDANDTLNNTVVTLTWNAATGGAPSYNVYWATAPGITIGGGGVTQVSLGNVLTFSHTGRSNGVRYYYVVTGVDAGGESVTSAEVSAKYGCKWGSTEAQGMNWGTGHWKPAADCPP